MLNRAKLAGHVATMAEALRRVGNEYRSIGLRERDGAKEYKVKVLAGPTTRAQSDAIFEQVVKHSGITEYQRARDPKLEEAQTFRLDVEAVNMHDATHAARNLIELLQVAAHDAGVPLGDLYVIVEPVEDEEE